MFLCGGESWHRRGQGAEGAAANTVREPGEATAATSEAFPIKNVSQQLQAAPQDSERI